MGLAAPSALNATIGIMVFWLAPGIAGLARMQDERFVFRILFPLCCLGGNFSESHASCGQVSNVIPVDVTVPGCPPTPYAIMRGVLTAIVQGKLRE